MVNLSANTQGFARDLNKGKSLVSGFASGLTKLAGIAGIGFGLAEAFSSIVSETTSAMRATRKLEAVLESTGGAAGVTANHVNDLADALSGSTSFDDDSIVDAAAVLATFDKVGGQSFDRAIKSAMDLSEVFGIDLQQSIKQVGKALQSPADGLTALRRIGVTFTEQQKEQIKALQESGDLMGAQSLILAELEHKFGGAAEKLASPWQQLKNELGNLAEAVGTSLKPAFDDFFSTVKVWVKDLRDDLEMIVKGPLQLIKEAREKAADEEARKMLPVGENPHGRMLREMRETQKSTSDALGEMFMQMSDGAEQMWRDSRTPLENLQEKFLEIADMLESGFIDQNIAGRLFAQLEEERKKLEPKLAEEKIVDEIDRHAALIQTADETPGGVGALQRGSSEAESAIQAAIRSANNNPLVKVAQYTKQTADATQQTATAVELLNQTVNELAVIGL